MKKITNTAIIIFFSVLMFCLLNACTWAVSHETTAEKEQIMKSDELELRGKQLRKAIDEEYKRRDEANELKRGMNDITAVVIKYISIGTSFDDAEAILRAAGFKVGEHSQERWFPKDGTLLYASDATIDHYKIPLPVGNTSIDVFLVPNNKDDWSTVRYLEAGIGIINYF